QYPQYMTVNRIVQTLKYFHQEHLKICCDVYKINESILSSVTAFGVGSNVYSNIFLITAFFYADFSLPQRAFTFTGIIAQLGGIYMVGMPLIVFTEQLYRSAKYMIRYQRFLDKRVIEEKLKIAYYFEFMHTDKKIQFTSGHFGTFARDSL